MRSNPIRLPPGGFRWNEWPVDRQQSTAWGRSSIQEQSSFPQTFLPVPGTSTGRLRAGGGRLSLFPQPRLRKCIASPHFRHVMPHSTGPSTPVATITALDEKLTDADATAPARFLHHHELTPENLPYWLVNVPQSQWTSECPAFLREQSPKNIQCLATPDAEYTRQNWELVQEIVSMWSLALSSSPAGHVDSGGTLLTKRGCLFRQEQTESIDSSASRVTSANTSSTRHRSRPNMVL